MNTNNQKILATYKKINVKKIMRRIILYSCNLVKIIIKMGGSSNAQRCLNNAIRVEIHLKKIPISEMKWV